MSIKISVIMPSLNVVPYIRQCLESVMNQTLQEIEILCVDAGSTDGTREILMEYAAREARIRLLDSPVRSYGYQVNMGIDVAKGKYIGVVETDDFVVQEMFAYLYDLAEKYDAEVAHADRFFVQNSGEVQINHIFDKRHQGLYFQKKDNVSMLSTHLSDMNIWDAIYRREFLHQHHIRCNESRGAAYQDIGFLQQVHTLARSFVYSDRPLYYYRVDRPGSSSSQLRHLSYVQQEWQFLEEGEITNSDQWLLHREAIYARLQQCFIWELKRTIQLRVPKKKWLQEAEWLRERIQMLTREGIRGEKYLTCEEQKMLFLVMKSLSSFADYVQTEQYFVDRPIKLILQWSEHGALIFGSGIRGKNVLKLLRDNGRKIIGFFDNDSSLWGKTIERVSVYPPEEIPTRLGEGDVIICNKYYWEEILDQIQTMGIPAERVHVYQP